VTAKLKQARKRARAIDLARLGALLPTDAAVRIAAHEYGRQRSGRIWCGWRRLMRVYGVARRLARLIGRAIRIAYADRVVFRRWLGADGRWRSGTFKLPAHVTTTRMSDYDEIRSMVPVSLPSARVLVAWHPKSDTPDVPPWLSSGPPAAFSQQAAALSR